MFLKYAIFLLFLISVSVTSCFDTIKNEQIVGPYFLIAIDSKEDMCIIYNESENYSGGAAVVNSTVFEINFNNNYIIAMQHPIEGVKETILHNYREQIFYNSKIEFNSAKVNTDSLARIKYDEDKLDGKLDNFYGKENKEITLYYLIDVKSKLPNSTLYLTKQELDSALLKLNVGVLDRKIYFQDLD